MRLFCCLTAVGLVAASAVAAPVWDSWTPVWTPVNEFQASSQTGPEVNNGAYVAFTFSTSGTSNRGYKANVGGLEAWVDKSMGSTRINYEQNAGLIPEHVILYDQPLFIEWKFNLAHGNDHQMPGVIAQVGGKRFLMLADGNFAGPGSWNPQQFTILDGSGFASNGVDSYGDRLNATDGQWHTMLIKMIPGNLTDSGEVEATISIDGGTDNGLGYGKNDKWLYGKPVKDTGSTGIKWMSSDSSPKKGNFEMATNYFRWTQQYIPEPATVGLILLGLPLLRRRRG